VLILQLWQCDLLQGIGVVLYGIVTTTTPGACYGGACVVIELVILLAQASGPFLVLTRLEKVNSPKPKLIFSLLNEIMHLHLS
jgi:hypothetical protein